MFPGFTHEKKSSEMIIIRNEIFKSGWFMIALSMLNNGQKSQNVPHWQIWHRSKGDMCPSGRTDGLYKGYLEHFQ